MGAALGPGDLVLSASTLARDTPLAERIEAAAAAGFRGIGLAPAHRARALEGGATDDDLRRLLAGHGLAVAEVQALAGWALDGDAGARSRRFEEAMLETAVALGAPSLIAVGDEDAPAVDVAPAADRFAALCDRAAAQGVAVALEFVPWTSIPDARSAWEIVRRAGRPNGGVLVDAWHHHRGAYDDCALRAIPGDRILGVHLCDATAERIGRPQDDGRHRRRLPGEGALDLRRFLGLLDDAGYAGPIAVEVLSDELHAQPPREIAHAAATAARAVLVRDR